MQHIVKKQIIQLKLHSPQDAFHAQQLMSDHYRHDLLPVMAKFFDEVSTERETYYIDSLEIDLGVLTEKDLAANRLEDEVLARLARELGEKLREPSSGLKKAEGRRSKAIGICGQWLFYMQRGYLPWNALQVDAEWKRQVLEALSADYASISALRNLIRSDVNAVMRIVEQHAESFLVLLIEILTARKQQHLAELLDELDILYRTSPKNMTQISSGQKIKIRKKFWEIILEVSAASETTGEDHQLFLQRILEKSFNRLIRFQDLMKDAPPKLFRLGPIIRTMEENAVAFSTDVSSEIAEEMDLPQNGHAEQTEEKPDLEEEGIFVRQAGAVLLHPFLGTFFSRLKLTKAGAFMNMQAQQKALCLVHYLCTGAAEAEEHELVVPKVLCGYPLKKPVKKQMHLHRKEKEEAEHLLEEVIRQWEKLKNTSPAGLRESFLKRGGKLVTKNEVWCVQVETGTIDVLLDHLPWNLSIIKLPWMKGLIRVKWR